MLQAIELFWLCSKNKMSRNMQYRIDFFIGIIISLGIAFVEPTLRYVFFKGVKGFPNWNIDQIILFQGVLLIWLGLKDTLFGEIIPSMQGMVSTGSFDRLLLKPYSPLVIIFTNGFSYMGFASLISGIAIVGYSIVKMQLMIKAWQIIVFMLFMTAGILLYVSIIIIYCSIVIHLISMGRLGEIINKLLSFSENPMEIFSNKVKIIMVMVVPFAIWIYLPAQVLLNRLDSASFVSIISSVVLFFLSKRVWKLSLKKYTSAGG